MKATAYLERSQIDRIVPFDERDELGMDRMYIDVDLGEVLNSKIGLSLKDGDRIQIFSVLDIRNNFVDINGAITRPGSYDIGDSLRVSELIKKADGVLGDAYLKRMDVIRTKEDFNRELIKLDLGQILSGNSDQDIYLQGLDLVRYMDSKR